MSGAIQFTGENAAPTLFRGVELRNADLTVTGKVDLYGNLEGNGTIHLSSGRFNPEVPITIAKPIHVIATGSGGYFGLTSDTKFFGTLDVHGGLTIGHRTKNYGSIHLHNGAYVNQAAMRQQDIPDPASWHFHSGSRWESTLFYPGEAAHFSFELAGATNHPIISASRLTANGTVRVTPTPSYMPRSDLPIQLWDVSGTMAGEFQEIELEDLPIGFAWDATELMSTGRLLIDGPAPTRIASTQFEEPAFDSISYAAGRFSSELGFETLLFPNAGNNARAGVNDFPGERVLSFQSFNSETTFDSVEIAEFATTAVDLFFSVSDTGFESSDFLEIVISDAQGRDEPIHLWEGLADFDARQLNSLSLPVPTHWSDVAVQINTKTDSSSGAERINLHALNIVGLPMEIRMEQPGDFAVDGVLDLADLSKLDVVIDRKIQNPAFDLDQNGRVEDADRIFWVEQLWESEFGDANLDGQFTSKDLVTVFQAGQFEDQGHQNSTWETGDWNGDREFNTSDLVLAFQRGGYEQAAMAASAVVPEPSLTLFNGLLMLIAVLNYHHRSRR